MNSIMERWIQACRHELLDRTLIFNRAHLLHALREYERHHNEFVWVSLHLWVGGHHTWRGAHRQFRRATRPVADAALSAGHVNPQRDHSHSGWISMGVLCFSGLGPKSVTRSSNPAGVTRG
jgi:hypothetical protein